MQNKLKIIRKQNRRRKYAGNAERPRLTVFRSNKYIAAQIIDDAAGITLVGITEKSVVTKGAKSERAHTLGKELAKKALDKKIAKIIFDKGKYAYHGRVKAFAEGAREGGLVF